jgi:glutathione peroxidase
MPTVYDFEIKSLTGQPSSWDEFKGKTLLIVNTATKCGFTPQLDGLEQLHKDYQDQGFSVIGFPSNQFADQEPLEGDDIQEFCQINYGVSFPIMEKTLVKGKGVHPLFDYLGVKKNNGRFNARPHWNFHKYLVNSEGEVVNFFLPFTKPGARRVRRAIEKQLELQKD